MASTTTAKKQAVADSSACFLPVDKPAGWTSHDVVEYARKLLGRKLKVGHAGTLDPLATGLLILLIGKATKLFRFVLLLPKCYVVTGRFGFSSDTWDADGNISTAGCSHEITQEDLLNTVKRFQGQIKQTPPPFSALRIKGKRAHELARKGKKVLLHPRTVKIYSIELLSYSYPDFVLKVECGSGTYIRSLVKDVGDALNCSAIVVRLRRLKIGKVSVETAIPVEKLSAQNIHFYLRSPDVLIPFPSIRLSDSVESILGKKIPVKYPDGMYKIYTGSTFAGVGKVEKGVLKLEVSLR